MLDRGGRRGTARRLTAGLVMVLASASLAACGGGGSGSDSSTITVWHGYTDVEAKALTKLAQQWNDDHPDQQVDLVFDGGNDGALQKTVAAFTAGNFPDVAYEFGSSAAQLAGARTCGWSMRSACPRTKRSRVWASDCCSTFAAT